MKTGLIKKDGSFIPIPYYNLLKYSKLLTEKYCQESLENKQCFLNFSKNYHTFTPYLDFVTRKLGYVIYNPFLVKNTILGRQGLILEIGKNKAFKIPTLDDKTLNIHKLNLPLENSVIDSNGLVYTLSREDRHPIYMLALLNYYLASDYNLYQKYLDFSYDKNLNEIIANIRFFMYQYCGISDISKYPDDSLVVIANEKYLTLEDINILKNEVSKKSGSLYEVVPDNNKVKENL